MSSEVFPIMTIFVKTMMNPAYSKTKLDVAKHVFSVAAPKIYESIATFMKNPKTYLFQMIYAHAKPLVVLTTYLP